MTPPGQSGRDPERGEAVAVSLAGQRRQRVRVRVRHRRRRAAPRRGVLGVQGVVKTGRAGHVICWPENNELHAGFLSHVAVYSLYI